MAKKMNGLKLNGVEIIEVVDEKAAEKARKKREKREKKGKRKGEDKAAAPEAAAEAVVPEPVVDEPVVEELVIEEPVAPEPEPVIEEPVTPEPMIEETAAEETAASGSVAVLTEENTEENTEESELDFLRSAMQLDPMPESEEPDSVIPESEEPKVEEFVMPEFEESESVMPEVKEAEEPKPEEPEPELDIASIFTSPAETAAETAVAAEEVPEDLSSLFGGMSAEPTSAETAAAKEVDLSDLFQSPSGISSEEEDDKGKKAKKRRKDKNQPMFISLDDENAAKLMGLTERPKQKKPKQGPFGFKKIPRRVYVAVICVLSAAVLGSAAFLFIILSDMTDAHLQPEERPHEIVLDNSVIAPNAFNHLFTNIPVPLEGIGLSILRFAFDDNAAEVQFNRDFNFSRFDIRLTDSFGQESSLSALYIDYDGRAAFPERTVRFSPITAGSLGFTLDFRDNWSGEETHLTFAFTAHHGLTAQRSFERLFGLRDSDGNVVGAVQSGTFASTGSRFYFTLDRENRGYGLRFEPELGSSAVSLVEHGRSILPLVGAAPVQLHDLGGSNVLGRADFRAIHNLTGNVELVFSRLFTELPINESVNALQFFYPDIVTGVPDPGRFAILEVGDYRIVIRYLLPSANQEFRLVFHAIDVNAPVYYEGDRSNRREVLLDCRLVFTMATGERVVLEAARGLSSNVGSNVFFRPDDSPFGRQILTRQFRSMELEIEGALIVLDDIVVNIDLDLILHDDDDIFEITAVQHFERQNAHRERYSAAVIAYERIGQNHRAIMREVWHENGSFVVVTSEIYGSIDRFTMRLEEHTELHRSYGIQ